MQSVSYYYSKVENLAGVSSVECNFKAENSNCDQRTLSYKINDVDYGEAFDIEQNKYRAAITFEMYSQGTVTLILYQHIY